MPSAPGNSATDHSRQIVSTEDVVRIMAKYTPENVEPEPVDSGVDSHPEAAISALPIAGSGAEPDDGSENPDVFGPRLRKATELVASGTPRWLATNRIQYGATNLLVGVEGIGKSLVWVIIVTHVTTGRALPEFGIPERRPGPVTLVITEDDWATVVRPRLEVAGADLDLITVICEDIDGTGAPTFPHHMPLITEAPTRPDLVVVDAWLDTVPGSLNVKDTQAARRALHPWKDAATKTGAAVLLIAHSNRIDSSNVRNLYGATVALRQVARMALFAVAGNAEGKLIVGPEKINAGPKLNASEFTITAVQHFEPTEDSDGKVARTDLSNGDIGATINGHVAAARTDAEAGVGRPRSDASNTVLAYVNSRPLGTRARHLVSAHPDLFPDEDKAGKYLNRLFKAGKIDRLGRGIFRPLQDTPDPVPLFVSEVSGSDQTRSSGPEIVPDSTADSEEKCPFGVPDTIQVPDTTHKRVLNCEKDTKDTSTRNMDSAVRSEELSEDEQRTADNALKLCIDQLGATIID